MGENYIELNLTKEQYNTISSCVNITFEFLKSMPIKNKDIKNKIKEIEKVKSEIFTL